MAWSFNNQEGERNKNWKGKEASYSSVHKWLRTHYGTPKYCEICKKTDRKAYHWASKDHKYTRNIEDYMRLCSSCHVKFDIFNNNYTGFWWTKLDAKHPTKK